MTDNSRYFDYAAATPVDPAVLEAMIPYYADAFFNPSAGYQSARDVRHDYESARATIASIFGAKPLEITFTAGATEANNLAIRGIMESDSEAEMIYSAVEHDSVIEPARQFISSICPVRPSGVIDLDQLSALITDKTLLISVMYANNEIGTVQPIKNVAALVSDIRKARLAAGITRPLYLHSDAAQAPNYLDMHVHRLGVDLLSVNGGKVYGPKQSGVLYVKSGLNVIPQIRGGGQERNVRSGTENVAGAIGLATALELASLNRPDEVERLRSLQTFFIQQLAAKVPSVAINGTMKQRLPNNIHITIPDSDNERLMMALDQAGFAVAVGSACSASSDEPSHVLAAIGLSESEARSSLRFTMGRFTTRSSIEQLIDKLAHTVLA